MNVKEKILKKIIRVDQAGELGAQQIYQGQKMIFKLQKNKKDFETADAIRDKLLELGVEINDSSDGTEWKLKS